jgi:hypothetical protein
MEHELSLSLAILCYRIVIKPTIGETSTMVRYLRTRFDMVVTSDTGLGRIYITSLKTHESVVCQYNKDGANRLKQVTGVEIDPAGKTEFLRMLFFNALASNSYHTLKDIICPFRF